MWLSMSPRQPNASKKRGSNSPAAESAADISRPLAIHSRYDHDISSPYLAVRPPASRGQGGHGAGARDGHGPPRLLRTGALLSAAPAPGAARPGWRRWRPPGAAIPGP